MTLFMVPGEVGKTTATVSVYAVNEGDVPNLPVVLNWGPDGEEPDTLAVPTGLWEEWKTFDPSDPRGYALVDRLIQRFITPADYVIVPILHHQRVRLDGLTPGIRYAVTLQVNGVPLYELALEERATRSCTFRTLPDCLPDSEDDESFNILLGSCFYRPRDKKGTFNILLGSCFYRPRDKKGTVGKTFDRLPPKYRPHVKALCGDQVYIDVPVRETSLRWWRSYRNPGHFRQMLLEKYCSNWRQ